MSDPGFRWLNEGGTWPSFARRGLVLDGVSLVLTPLPRLDRVVTVAEGMDVVAMAVGPHGELYLLTAEGRVLRDGEPLPCLGGVGDELGQFSDPRGLAVLPGGRLAVADSGNRRIQVVDVASGQVVGVFESGSVAALAALFMARVPPGQVVAFTVVGGVVFVLDAKADAVVAFHPDGTEAAPPVPVPTDLPTALAVTADRLYVGTAAGSVIAMTRSGEVLGETPVTTMPVLGLAVDRDGRVLALAGDAVHALAPDEGRAEDGAFLGGPFSVGERAVDWQLLRLVLSAPGSTHVQLFTMVSDTYAAVSLPAAESAWAALSPLRSGPDPAPLGEWRAGPPDHAAVGLLHEPGRCLWIGGVVRGDGRSTPVIETMRVEFDSEGWTAHLPALYRREGRTGALRQLLDGLRSRLDEDEELIAGMSSLFDPKAAPGQWLDWLAGWVAVELDEGWSDERRRAAVASAFAAHARRGTVRGLVELIEARLGVTARVEEPGRALAPWALGATSVLGFETLLSPAEAQGAVIGTTADLGEAFLLDPEDFGAPIFEPLANRFCVQVLEADLCAHAGRNGEEALRRLVAAEKPAHASGHVCVIEPRLTVGVQARVGVDAIVGGPPAPLVLDDGGGLGMDSVLEGRRATAVVGLAEVTG